MSAVVISLSIIPSSTQLISGIPTSVSITSNIACTIFYTLDGTAPIVGVSDIYVAPISLPTNQPSVTLSLYATNGVDSSDVITLRYAPEDLPTARRPHALVTIVDDLSNLSICSGGETQRVKYHQPGGWTIDDNDLTNKFVDGYGYEPLIYPMRGSDEEIPIFSIKYSESNSKGEVGADIGTMPAKVKEIYLPPAPQQSDLNRPTFNPKAMVVFHDGRVPNSNQLEIFRPFFDDTDYEKELYGAKLNTTAFKDGDSAPSGGLLRYLYNPTDNTITFYYRDSRSNRWIVSKEEFKRTSVANAGDSRAWSQFATPSSSPALVFRWIYNRRSHLL